MRYFSATQGLIIGKEDDAAEREGDAEKGDGSGPLPCAERMLTRVQPEDVQIEIRCFRSDSK